MRSGGSDDDRDEPHRKSDDHEAYGFVAKSERRENRLDQLDDEPGRDDVARGYAEDVSSFQFGNQRHPSRQHVLVRTAAPS